MNHSTLATAAPSLAEQPSLAPSLSKHQRSMGLHLRDPDNAPAPEGLDARRLGIYRELVFNNIESQLSGAFPVINSILSAQQWQALVREFLRDYRAQTPYFTQLSAEFVDFLANRDLDKLSNKELDNKLPAFLLELAHYERVELDIFMMDKTENEISNAAFESADTSNIDLLNKPLSLASTTQLLAYAYPVHKVSPDFIPEQAPAQPTLLLLFQDDEQEVRFFELQPLAYQVLCKLSDGQAIKGLTLLGSIAKDIKLEVSETFLQQGLALLAQLNALNVFVSAQS